MSQILDFLRSTFRIPSTLPNGYPDMAGVMRQNNIAEAVRRINGGNRNRFMENVYGLIPPPPPTRSEQTSPMIAEVIKNATYQSPRNTPSTTSSLYQQRWCGTTVTDVVEKTEEKDPYVLDHQPLKRMLMKLVPWILDVTEVRVRQTFGTGGYAQVIDGVMHGPLEIHIIVSPTHHSELMNPKIEIEVREKLFIHLLPLVRCMYENNSSMHPIIIFSPSHSETILEYVK